MKTDEEILRASDRVVAELGADASGDHEARFNLIVARTAEAADEDPEWVRIVLVDRIVSAGAG